jgi:hypothetical protein
MRRIEERKRHDSLRSATEHPKGTVALAKVAVGRPALFYTIKNKHGYKNGLDGLAWLLPTIDDEYRLTGYFEDRMPCTMSVSPIKAVQSL